jgi:class 3 adenylate cyclase
MLTCFTFRPKLASRVAGFGHPVGSGESMADYRAYLVGSDGHFYEAVALVCADDAEAIQKAKKLVDHREVELWQLDRKVATFESRSIE